MREKFNDILKNHGIYGENIEEILYAVSDIFEFVAKETKKSKPYATNSIDCLETAAYEVNDLSNCL